MFLTQIFPVFTLHEGFVLSFSALENCWNTCKHAFFFSISPPMLLATSVLLTSLVLPSLQPIMKPQVKIIHKNRNSFRGIVGQLLDRKDERGMKDQLCNELQLSEIIDREVAKLSGGELQRVGIAAAALQSAEIYMFDEPSSYLDVRQRLNAARVIKSLLRTNRYVIVVNLLSLLTENSRKLAYLISLIFFPAMLS